MHFVSWRMPLHFIHKCRYDDMWDVCHFLNTISVLKWDTFLCLRWSLVYMTLSEVLLYIFYLDIWFLMTTIDVPVLYIASHIKTKHHTKNYKYFTTHNFKILHFTKDTHKFILCSYLGCQHFCFFFDYSFFSVSFCGVKFHSLLLP